MKMKKILNCLMLLIPFNAFVPGMGESVNRN